MNVRPILFNTEMVKAILEGRKTQTRRLVKQPPIVGDILHDEKGWYYEDGTRNGHSLIPPCHPGDILWVRETWAEMPYGFVYKADDECPEGWDAYDHWYPSIHMPKEAARSFLRVRDVRVELLRNVFFTDGAAIMEIQKEGVDIGETCRACIEHYGCPCCIDADGDTECVELDNPRYVFSKLWDSTIKPADLPRHGWIANPWVWVIEFERIEKPEGWCR